MTFFGTRRRHCCCAHVSKKAPTAKPNTLCVNVNLSLEHSLQPAVPSRSTPGCGVWVRCYNALRGMFALNPVVFAGSTNE